MAKKFIEFDLNEDVVGTYDETKTYVTGNMMQKVINSEDVVGSPATFFTDNQTANALALSGFVSASSNGYVFLTTAITAGVASLLVYSIDYTENTTVYLGRVLIVFPNIPAATHTIRSIRADASNTSEIKVFITTVSAGTNAIVNGGNFLVNKLAIADFTTGPSPITIQFAVDDDLRAMYWQQDPAGLGQSNNMTTVVGNALKSNELFSIQGTAASFNIQGFDTTIAPTIAKLSATAPTIGTSTWSVAGHAFVANDMVSFTTSGAAPGGFTASTTAVHQVYFVRNPIAGTSFELSATFGGASINASSNGSGTFNVFRSYGSTTATHVAGRKTGTITSGFAGTALLLDNIMGVTVPALDSTNPNTGHNVIFFPTTSNFYNFRIADITAGATTLPTATAVNNLGTGTDYTAPANILAFYSEEIGAVVYTTATYQWLAKRWINSKILANFGSQAITWLENTGRDTDYFRAFATNGGCVSNGYLFVTTTTAGQRGFLSVDLRSDHSFDYSYATSPVKYIGRNKLKFIATYEQNFEITDNVVVYYRSASTAGDSIFNTATGGWSLLPLDFAANLESITVDKYVQLKIMNTVLSILSGTPPQVHEVVLGYDDLEANDDRWVMSHKNTSNDGDSPFYAAARLQKAYDIAMPAELIFDIIDDSENVISTFSTVTDAANFSYSTNNGTSWNALGTIPNTALTTELRVLISSPASGPHRLVVREP
jgi:hypothetical protein